jgi:exosortase/archaeosortase
MGKVARPAMAAPNETTLPRRIWFREEPWRFVLVAAFLMVVSYTLLYFPYLAGSLPARMLTSYLRLVARLSATGAWIFDHRVFASGDVVQGRFQLQIVLDCAALDAQALFASAVLAFPTTGLKRALGLLVGTVLLATINVARIVVLYVIALQARRRCW